MSSPPLLACERLSKSFETRVACRDLSFELFDGEILGIVGESGSGKTTLLHCLAGLLEPSAGRVLHRIGDEMVDLYALDEPARRHIARTRSGIVEQHPHEGLRMQMTAGANVAERLLGRGVRRFATLRAGAAAALAEVEIPADRIDDTPAALSGGMRQRLQIARSLASEPKLIFMDEPTGGLDLSVQATILDLIRRVCDHRHVAVVLVTHDLGVARVLTQRLLVMQAGLIVEAGLTDQILDDPWHPYTQLLVSSMLCA